MYRFERAAGSVRIKYEDRRRDGGRAAVPARENPGSVFGMMNKSRRSSILGGRDPRAGQAYTEYLVILVFGVFMCLGVVVVDRVLLPEEVRIMDRLYGYIFDYYAGLANFINLPIF